MDSDTIICESLLTSSKSTLALSCAPTHDSARGFNSCLFTILTAPLHLTIYQPRSHQLSYDWMLLCDWAALYSAVEQLAVRTSLQTPSLLCGSGCGQARLAQFCWETMCATNCKLTQSPCFSTDHSLLSSRLITASNSCATSPFHLLHKPSSHLDPHAFLQ